MKANIRCSILFHLLVPGGVVVHPHTDPAAVIGQIVYPVGNGLAQILVQEIMQPHFFRLPLRLPFSPHIFEVAHQLFFLGVHRYHRLATTIKALGKRVDVFKLRIAVGVLPALQRLGISLKAIVELVQQVGDFSRRVSSMVIGLGMIRPEHLSQATT